MNTAVINIKIDPETKRKVQKVARDMGVPLSALIKSHLKEIARTKQVHLNAEEKPTPYLLRMLKESEADIRAGRFVSFETPEEEMAYLDKLIKDAKSSR